MSSFCKNSPKAVEDRSQHLQGILIWVHHLDTCASAIRQENLGAADTGIGEEQVQVQRQSVEKWPDLLMVVWLSGTLPTWLAHRHAALGGPRQVN
jgi:hypothetical protein